MSTRSTLLLLPAVALVACSQAEPVNLPAGVTCKTTNTGPVDSTSLAAALDAAQAGDCVVPRPGTYLGNFVVKSGVTLVGETDKPVEIQGDRPADPATPAAPAIKVLGGASSGVVNVSVISAPGIGILVDGAPATLSQVKVTNAADTGVLVACRDATCQGVEVSLNEVEVSGSSLGVWAVGSTVSMKGGKSFGNQGTSLASGYGVVASGGAKLSMDGTVVEKNAQVGVLVDGKNDTSANINNARVQNNLGRGIWAQGLLGSDTSPRLQITGQDSLVDNNRIVGIGARNSRGIIIVNCRVANTVAVNLPDETGKLQPVGDGVGVFEKSGAIKLDGAELTGNARSQMLVDKGDKGIIIVNCRVASGGGQYNVVVQNTTDKVDSPPELSSTVANPLLVNAPEVSLSGAP